MIRITELAFDILNKEIMGDIVYRPKILLSKSHSIALCPYYKPFFTEYDMTLNSPFPDDYDQALFDIKLENIETKFAKQNDFLTLFQAANDLAIEHEVKWNAGIMAIDENWAKLAIYFYDSTLAIHSALGVTLKLSHTISF
jgi:hypothetical protein